MIAHPSQLPAPVPWAQLAKFAAVGASGYAVNLAVFTLLVGLGAGFRPAACGSFLVAVFNNYCWHRHWTFRATSGRIALQGARFLTVSLLALGCNVLFLSALVDGGFAPVTAQAAAIVFATPLSFLATKLWSFAP